MAWSRFEDKRSILPSFRLIVAQIFVRTSYSSAAAAAGLGNDDLPPREGEACKPNLL
jgi:hypothetical protein